MPVINITSDLSTLPADAVNVRDISASYPVEGNPDHKLYQFEQYTGCVISTRERNGYDDSDFYALVWVGGKAVEICYASTRYWSYACGAKVDATPEVLALYAAECEARAEVYRKEAAERDAKLPKINRVVEVVAGRKYPKGTRGIVRWHGINQFATPRYRNRDRDLAASFGLLPSREYERLSIELADGSRVFIDGKNVQVVEDAVLELLV